MTFHLAASSSSAEQKECYIDFPPAIALPAWACNHYAIDSLMDTCDAVLYSRSIAALARAVVPKVSSGKIKSVSCRPNSN